MGKTTLALFALLALSAAPGGADGAVDDLAVVRKAVSSSARAVEASPERLRARDGEEPQWIRVRIVEKGAQKAKVSVNLPLALVRALGDDVPIPACEGRDDARGRSLSLGDVLRALDSGESLVEIDDAEATVRIWVE